MRVLHGKATRIAPDILLHSGQHLYHPTHVKALARRGQALLGMQAFRQALASFEEALKVDLGSPHLSQG